VPEPQDGDGAPDAFVGGDQLPEPEDRDGAPDAFAEGDQLPASLLWPQPGASDQVGTGTAETGTIMTLVTVEIKVELGNSSSHDSVADSA